MYERSVTLRERAQTPLPFIAPVAQLAEHRILNPCVRVQVPSGAQSFVMAKAQYTQCFKTRHVKDCRPARPLCKWMRKVQPQRRVCHCDRYHFPHRFTSGRCGDIEKMWDFAYGPDWRDDRDERLAIQTEGEGGGMPPPYDPEVPF